MLSGETLQSSSSSAFAKISFRSSLNFMSDGKLNEIILSRRYEKFSIKQFSIGTMDVPWEVVKCMKMSRAGGILMYHHKSYQVKRF